jgi:hypothetical protein
MPDGSRIVTLIDQLDAALKEAGLQKNSFCEKYSIYSWIELCRYRLRAVLGRT